MSAERQMARGRQGRLGRLDEGGVHAAVPGRRLPAPPAPPHVGSLVNSGLTVDRPRRRRRKSVEPADFAAMIRRMLRAHGRRVVYADIEDLAKLVELQVFVEEVIADTIDAMRAEQGFSWSSIAAATGTTKQGAQQRWGPMNRQTSTPTDAVHLDLPFCQWCVTAIEVDDEVEQREAGTRIGELVSMHAACAEEWDRA